MYQLIQLATGTAHYKQYEKFAIDGKREYDRELVESLSDYVKWALVAMIFSLIILLAGSFKFPALTKSFYFHQMLFHCLVHTLPRDFGAF